MLFIISYDLVDKGPDDYEDLQAALLKLGAKRILYSQWALRKEGTSAKKLRDTLIEFFRGRDRLLVTEVTKAAWSDPLLADLKKI